MSPLSTLKLIMSSSGLMMITKVIRSIQKGVATHDSRSKSDIAKTTAAEIIVSVIAAIMKVRGVRHNSVNFLFRERFPQLHGDEPKMWVFQNLNAGEALCLLRLADTTDATLFITIFKYKQREAEEAAQADMGSSSLAFQEHTTAMV